MCLYKSSRASDSAPKLSVANQMMPGYLVIPTAAKDNWGFSWVVSCKSIPYCCWTKNCPWLKKSCVSAKRENSKFETHSWALLLAIYSDYMYKNIMLCHCSSPKAFTFHVLNAVLLGVWHKGKPHSRNRNKRVREQIKLLASKHLNPKPYRTTAGGQGKGEGCYPGSGTSWQGSRKGCPQAVLLIGAGTVQENNPSCQFCSHLLADVDAMMWMGPAQSFTSVICSPSNQKKFWWHQPGVLLQHSQLTRLISEPSALKPSLLARKSFPQ